MPGPLVSFDPREADRSSEADQRNPVALLLHTLRDRWISWLLRDTSRRTASRASAGR